MSTFAFSVTNCFIRTAPIFITEFYMFVFDVWLRLVTASDC